MTGNRYPQPTLVVDVVAIQRGTTDPNRVIIIQGHLDSRNSTNENVTDDAPGANDDASGVAAVMESARILSKRKFGATIVYAALSGEEQGLSGGTILANYAKAQGWQVEAVLNNDIVGNSRGFNGKIDDRTVRVFSEGVRATETPQMAAARKTNGGEVDSPSRNLARYVAGIAEQHMKDFRVRMIYRRDRYGRGGDQTPFQDAGYPAVRVTEGAENWNHQHQNIRTENGVFYGDTIEYVDFAYLARVTRLNAMALASLASAPPPLEVTVQGAGGGIIFIDDKARGLHEGYLVTPITKLELIAGFNISGTIRAVLAGMSIMVIGSLIAGIPDALDPMRMLRLFVVITVTAFALISMMFLMMVRVTDPLMPRAVFGVLNTLLYFPSGAVYPQQGFPGWMQVIAVADPFTYAVHAFKSLLLKNTGFGAITGDLLYLSIFSVVALSAATFLFKRTL